MVVAHANTHVAIGVTITALLSIIFPLSWFEFFLATCGSFAQDFDFLLSKSAQDENHRLLITHSLWLGVGAIVVGFPLAMPWVTIVGVNSVCHVLIDSVDWGVTLFGQRKLSGLKILYRGKNCTPKEIKERYPNCPNFRCYFIIQWYRNPFMRAIEGGSIFGMVTSLLFVDDPLKLLVLIPYVFFACLHYLLFLQCLHRYKITHVTLEKT